MDNISPSTQKRLDDHMSAHPEWYDTRSIQSEKQLEFKRDLEAVIIGLQTMLIDKNVKYGDAALSPNQTFSRCDSIELINVRIDDKLSRIRNAKCDRHEDEDVELDLIGYLILKQIAKRRLGRSK